MLDSGTVGALVLVFLLGVSVGAGFASWKLRPRETRVGKDWWAEWLQGISTEMAGAVVTAIFLTFILGIIQNGETQRATVADEKDQLILQMGSAANEVAIEAVRQLNEKHWLNDGTLHNANLTGANLNDAGLQSGDFTDAVLNSATLQRADLNQATLVGTHLQGADLRNANLENANLTNAQMQRANLQQASLAGANLSGADLTDAVIDMFSLKGANLTGAILQGVNMRQADLENTVLTGADLRGAILVGVDLTGKDLSNAQIDDTTIFGASTILPDGTNWRPGTDMTKFTQGGN